jgi:hypothetical protein
MDRTGGTETVRSFVLPGAALPRLEMSAVSEGRVGTPVETLFKYSRRGLDGGCPSADAASLVEVSAITVRRHVISEKITLLENPAARWVSVGLDQDNDIRLITPLP